MRPGPGMGTWSVGLWGPGWARGSGARNHAGPAQGCFYRLLDFLLFLSMLQGGQNDGPGWEPSRAALGDFGRPLRLLWRADGRLPYSDKVRPIGSGAGCSGGSWGERSWGGTRNEFVYSTSWAAGRTLGSRANAEGGRVRGRRRSRLLRCLRCAFGMGKPAPMSCNRRIRKSWVGSGQAGGVVFSVGRLCVGTVWQPRIGFLVESSDPSIILIASAHIPPPPPAKHWVFCSDWEIAWRG